MPHKKREVTQRDSFCELGPLKVCINYLQILCCWNGPQARKKNCSIFIEKKQQQTTFCPKRQMRSRVRSPAPLYRMTPLYLTVSKKYEKEKNFLSFLLLGADSTLTSELVNLIYKRFHFILGIHRVRAQSETRLSST